MDLIDDLVECARLIGRLESDPRLSREGHIIRVGLYKALNDKTRALRAGMLNPGRPAGGIPPAPESSASGSAGRPPEGTT